MARTAEEIAEGKRAWRRNNPEYKKAWYAANREKACEDSRQWARDNAEHCRKARRARYLANKSSILSKTKAYRKANPEVKKAAQQRRRAPGYISANTLKEVATCCDGVCSYCLRTALKLTLDHIVPISKGGTNVTENLTMACASCNSRKNDRTLLDLLLMGVFK